MSSTDPQRPKGSGDAPTQKMPRVGQQDKSSGSEGKPASRSTGTSSGRPSSGAAPASRPGPGKAGAGKQGAGKAAGPEATTQGSKAAGSSAQGTGTGRSGSSTASAAKGATSSSSRSIPSGSVKKSAAKESSGNKKGRTTQGPMTARDYARTTRDSSDSTSVIPAVRDAPSSSRSTTTAPATAADEGATGRIARLRLVHVEPWSVTRLAFVVSVALMIVAVVGVVIFWVVLDLAGVWDSLNGSITNVLSDGEGTFDLTDYLGLGRLVGMTLLLSAINVIVMTMIATIAAHLYNLAAQLLGGISLTFSDS